MFYKMLKKRPENRTFNNFKEIFNIYTKYDKAKYADEIKKEFLREIKKYSPINNPELHHN